jgi:hypothetical protein
MWSLVFGEKILVMGGEGVEVERPTEKEGKIWRNVAKGCDCFHGFPTAALA